MNTLRDFLTEEEYRQTIKETKAELIMNGTFGAYCRMRKEAYNEGYTPSEDPKDYGFESDFFKEMCDSLLHSKKNKKSEARKHIQFMSDFYDNIGFLTLSFADSKVASMSYEWMRKKVCSVLSECFGDFIGRPELSKKGRIHFHFIVGWNGIVATKQTRRDGHINELVMNKHDLQEQWYGENDGTGQPTKYGIFDLILISSNAERQEKNKIGNYLMKSLYTMESYITKQDETDFTGEIDKELLLQINSSNTIVARNTPYQAWRKDKAEQDRFIKHQARVFDSAFYEQNKYDSKAIFRAWAEHNKGVLLTENGRDGKPLYLIPTDYKTVEIADYQERQNE